MYVNLNGPNLIQNRLLLLFQLKYLTQSSQSQYESFKFRKLNANFSAENYLTYKVKGKSCIFPTGNFVIKSSLEYRNNDWDIIYPE